MDAPRLEQKGMGTGGTFLWDLFPLTAAWVIVGSRQEKVLHLSLSPSPSWSWARRTSGGSKPQFCRINPAPVPTKCPLQAAGKGGKRRFALPTPQHSSSARREPQRGSGAFLTAFTLEIQVLPHLGNNLVTQEGVKLQHWRGRQHRQPRAVAFPHIPESLLALEKGMCVTLHPSVLDWTGRAPNRPLEPHEASSTSQEQLMSTELETTEKMRERNQSGFLILQKGQEKTKEKQK